MQGDLLRKRDGGHARVSPVELFFDLVFVFAVTQLSHHLLAHLTLAGIGETLLLLFGVCWAWLYTSWATNWLDPDHFLVRLLLFALMAAAMVLAMTIPEAWTTRGLAFALAYGFIQVGRSLFVMAALRRHHRVNYRNFKRITLWLAAATALWIAGGLAEPEMRLWFWIAAIAVELTGPFLSYYVPGLGRSATTDWDIEGTHMAERAGLFIIILLGESIIITGSTAAERHWTNVDAAAFAGAFLATVAMWWIYFNIGAERAAHHIEASQDPGRFARLVYNYIHLPIIAGILATAAADELILAHPDGHLEGLQRALVIGGPALFLIGNFLFKWTTANRGPLSHLIGLALLASLALVSGHMDPWLLSLATSLVLIVVATWETVSFRRAQPS